MVTNSVWADMDGDQKNDLITVSEWGTVKIYKNSGRRLGKLTTSLDSIPGWWNAVLAEDLDKDGDIDLVLGNQGSNLHYSPTPDKPMKMWINDFDNNGTIEQIVTQHYEGKRLSNSSEERVNRTTGNLKKAKS